MAGETVRVGWTAHNGFMNQGRAVVSQLISFLPDREFRRCVERCQGNSRLRGFSCWDQCHGFRTTHLSRELRDIEACLHSVGGEAYNLGFRGKVARSTLADAMSRMIGL